MSEKYVTPLAQLMEILYLPGAALAREVHIDRSIISRWKNGRADLNLRTPYFSDVVDALVRVNESQGLHILERFFESIEGFVPDDYTHTETELKRLVSVWLLKKPEELPDPPVEKAREAEESGKITGIYKIYRGLRGKTAAFIELLDNYADASSPQRIIGYDRGSNLDYANVQGRKNLQNKICEVVNRGHDFKMMLYLNRPGEEIYELLDFWVPVFLKTKADGLFTYNSDPTFYDFIFSVEKKATVAGIYGKNEGELYTVLYTNPVTQRQFDNFFKGHLKNFTPLVTRLSREDGADDYSYLDIASESWTDTVQYLFTMGTPAFIPSVALAQAILDELELSRDEAEIMKRHLRSTKDSILPKENEKSSLRLIINSDYIRGLKTTENIELPFYTSLLGRKICLPRRYVIRELLDLVAYAGANDHLEVGLRDKNLPPFMDDFSLWVVEKEFACFYNYQDLRSRVIVKEFQSVNIFFTMLDKYWEDLPYSCKDPAWVARELKNLLGLATSRGKAAATEM